MQSNAKSQGLCLIGIKRREAEINDALRQEQARHEAAVKNMHRLRALRLQHDKKPKARNCRQDGAQAGPYRVPLVPRHLMFALPPKADMVQHDRDVCFVPKADSYTATEFIRSLRPLRRVAQSVQLDQDL